jgi:hypothetical protein
MKNLIYVAILSLCMVACKSPTELDVDRTLKYMDGAVHPTRLTFYYYFGDSAYEAIVIDTSMLNTIWIEDKAKDYAVTIPQFIFSLPDTLNASASHTPFVRKLCFSINRQPCNGVYTNCQNPSTWLAGDYIGSNNTLVPFVWNTDNTSKQLRLAFYKVNSLNIVKGAMQIVIADPMFPRFEIYHALITMEYD